MANSKAGAGICEGGRQKSIKKKRINEREEQENKRRRISGASHGVRVKVKIIEEKEKAQRQKVDGII